MSLATVTKSQDFGSSLHDIDNFDNELAPWLHSVQKYRKISIKTVREFDSLLKNVIFWNL